MRISGMNSQMLDSLFSSLPKGSCFSNIDLLEYSNIQHGSTYKVAKKYFATYNADGSVSIMSTSKVIDEYR